MKINTEFGEVNIEIEFNKTTEIVDRNYINKNLKTCINNLDWMFKRANNVKSDLKDSKNIHN